MTNNERNNTTPAIQNEQNSETILDTQEVLKETSSSKRVLPSINFDISIAPTEQSVPAAEKLIKAQQATFNAAAQRITEIAPAAEKLIKAQQKLIEGITLYLPSPADIIHELMVAIQPILNSFKDFELYVEKLKPFIEKELKKEQQKHTEIKDITVDDIATISIFNLLNVDETELEQLKKEFANNQDPVINNIDLLLDIVRRAKEAFEVDKEKSLLPQISPKKITELQYPLDKVNSYLWGLMINETVALKAESDKDSKKGKQANIYVLLDFDELDGVKISRQLTSYDKRVFIAVANLKAQGHDTITAEQIYKAMGNPKRPNADTIKKILQSVECISRGRVTIDNTEEAKMYTRYDRVKATFPLLTTEICSGYANGKVVDNAIKVLEVPRLLTFAEKRGQLTTVPLRLLESPISKTEANLLLEDYLFNRIARMRNSPKITRTILLETVYQKCNVISKMQKSRLPEKIERLLQFYKDESWIKGFIITEHSIEIKT